MPRIGVEIHQRIKGGKLFCSCPSLPGEGFDDVIYRELHLSKSEMGEEDIAAVREVERGARYFYQYSRENGCLVELDEEPPHMPNEGAITAAVAFALMFRSQLVKELIFMRKVVLDGSNVSGFQRTGLLAFGGSVETSQGPVALETISLEEESAHRVEGNVYHLWRLGIPLIEISTAPEIKDGSHAREVVEKIGVMLRSTGLVERGIGTIRQDLNVSVEGGARVEIKGAQELRLIAEWVDGEIERQRKLIELIGELKERGAYEELRRQGFQPTPLKLTVERENFLSKSLKRGAKALGLKLPHHRGLLGRELYKRRYGSELSDYAKRAGVGGLIHGDEDMEKYGLSREEVEGQLSVGEGDSFIIVVGEEERALRALRWAYERALMDYVPKETRRALPNGATAYLRPLPGRARLYPETDIPPIDLSPYIERAKELAVDFEALKAWLERVAGREYGKRLVKSERLPLYREMVEAFGEEWGKDIAWLLEDAVKEGDGEEIREAFRLYVEGKVAKKALPKVVEALRKGEGWEQWRRITGDELRRIVEELGDVKEVMKRYALRVDGKEVVELLQELQGKEGKAK